MGQGAGKATEGPEVMRQPLPEQVRSAVFRRDDFTCRYCGFKCRGKFPEYTSPSVDHVTPVARGGTDEMDNLVTACLRCNWRKRAGSAPESGQFLPPDAAPFARLRQLHAQRVEAERRAAEADAAARCLAAEANSLGHSIGDIAKALGVSRRHAQTLVETGRRLT